MLHKLGLGGGCTFSTFTTFSTEEETTGLAGVTVVLTEAPLVVAPPAFEESPASGGG